MARDNSVVREIAHTKGSEEEARGLLPQLGDEQDPTEDLADGEEDDLVVYNRSSPPAAKAASLQRQSSFAHPRPHGAPPRTSQRVRFDVAEPETIAREPTEWMEEDDYMNGDAAGEGGGTARAPLLTGIEAPSVQLANDIEQRAEEALESARPRSGLSSAFMNMANSIIGAGIIGQPYAFKQAGLLSGIVLLVLLTVTVDWTIRLIVKNSKLSGANSFQTTMEYCFGKSGLVAISIAQWAFAFGGMVAFCIIIGDTIPRMLGALFPSLRSTPVLWLLTDRRAIIVVFVLGLSYPLSLYRDIAMLAKASTLALISMLIIIITVVSQAPLMPADLRGPVRGSLIINDGIFQAIGVISFAFVCHHNSLLIYGSLKTPTMDRFATVTHYSTGVSMAACLIMALSGYLSFGDRTQGNVLNNFPDNNLLVNIARLCFGLNMLTTLPLECFVCREVMTLYYFPHEPFQPNRHLIFTTSLVISAMAMALITCDLGIVFELVGATSACALAYILPPLCFLRLSSRRSWESWAAYACITFGCCVMSITLLQAMTKIFRGDGGSQTCS